jgi:hypothetical protein
LRASDPLTHFALFADLLTATPENRGPIVDCIEKDISRRIGGADERESLLAIDGGINLRLGLHYSPHHGEVGQDSYKFWSEVSDRIFDSCSARILELSAKDHATWMYCYLRDRVGIASFFELFGHRRLFSDFTYRMYPEVHGASLANIVVWPALYGYREGVRLRPGFEARLRDLSIVGKRLASVTPPWFQTAPGQPEFPFRHWGLDPDYDAGDVDLDPDSTFGGFAIVAAQLSGMDERTDVEPVVRFVTQSRFPLFKRVGWVLAARFDAKHLDRATEQLAGLDMPHEQKQLMFAWMGRRVQFATIGHSWPKPA